MGPFIPTHAANRVLGSYIPSSAPPLSGRFSFCSGERLLLTPRGPSLDAPIEGFGRTRAGGKHQYGLRQPRDKRAEGGGQECRCLSAASAKARNVIRPACAAEVVSKVGRGECPLPGAFRCAGLMVPDPSIMLPPMPFMEVVTGWEVVVEYMASGEGSGRG